LLQLVVVVVAEVEVVVASVAVEALGGVPQGMGVVLPMGPLPLPTAVLVVDTAMDVSSLQSSQPQILPCCLAGPDAASTHHVCHIHLSCCTAMQLCTAFQGIAFLAFSAVEASAGCFCIQAEVRVTQAAPSIT